MMNFIAAAILSGAAVLAGGAQTPIERSGNVYHAAVCGAAKAGAVRCNAHIVTDAQGNPKTTTAGVPAGFSPASLRAAYNISATGSSSTVVAIVDAYGYPSAEADLAVYRTQFGLPACTTANLCFRKISQTGSTTKLPAYDNGWSQESGLDLDMVSAMCPACKIVLVEANSTSDTDLSAAENYAANVIHANVISNSYGGGEGGSQSYEAAYNHPGVVITASTGDEGYGAQFPATSPHVTAVGGTSLYLAASTTRGWMETAWAGAGSGCSLLYTKPSWQHDSGCAKRMEADVSAIADPQTGVAVYAPQTGRPNSPTRAAWLVFGGTSVAAPLIAGVYGAAGNASLLNYGQTPYLNLGGLNDVTSGANGSCNSYFCHAGVGYDGPTGLGTPNGISAF